MNIVTEPKLSGKPIADKPHKRPVRLVRWFLIVGLLLAAIVGGSGVLQVRLSAQSVQADLQQAAAADQRQHRHGEVRNHSEPPDRGRRSRRRASGQCHVRRQRPHHRYPVHGGRQREGGHAAGADVRRSRAGRPCQLQGAAARGADLAGSRQATGRAPGSDRRRRWIPRRRRSIRPAPASPRPKPSSRRSWCGRRSTANSAFARSRSDNI